MSSFYTVCRPPSVDGVAELVRGEVQGRAGGNVGHPPHWHSQWQLVAVTGGDGWVRVDGVQHRTPAGSIFVVPPEVVHSNNVYAEGCEFRSMLLDADFFEEAAVSLGLRKGRMQFISSPVIGSRSITRRFDRFHRQLEDERPRMDLEHELLDWVATLLGWQTGQNISSLRTIAHPAARRAREYLWSRASESLSLMDLSIDVGLSRFELCRAFKDAYGMPPHAWQLQARVQRAKELLKRGVSSGEAALQTGFADQAHLCRVFKRATGFTPARYASEFRKIVQDSRSIGIEAGA